MHVPAQPAHPFDHELPVPRGLDERPEPALFPRHDDSIDLTGVAFALSDALDLVGLGMVQHGKRVAYLAGEVARAAGIDAEARDELFLASLLHDCGVSRTAVHRQLVSRFDWEGAPEHCRRGAQLLCAFEPFALQADIVLLHHTRWNDEAMTGFPPATARLANLVHLADRVDVLVRWAHGDDPLIARRDIRRTIAGLRGSFFSPELVEAFLHASEAEAFWLTLEPHHLERYLQEVESTSRPRPAGPEGLRQLAGLFAQIVDAKSPFTADHSTGVARLAHRLGGLAGLDDATRTKLELAGLLHDLGKLRVPDEVLEKPAPLDERERAEMEHHTFETWQILRRVDAFGDIAGWAAWHHEKLTGTGYPFHRCDRELPIPARVVSVSDVFQALAQDRPYRKSLENDEILGIMQEMSEKGHLDPTLVDLVSSNADVCREAAVGAPSAVAAEA